MARILSLSYFPAPIPQGIHSTSKLVDSYEAIPFDKFNHSFKSNVSLAELIIISTGLNFPQL